MVVGNVEGGFVSSSFGKVVELNTEVVIKEEHG